jgi:very-short-patch-repair endonuclease
VSSPLGYGRSRIKLPKALSKGEETFALHMKARGLNPVREFMFAPSRKYRADFAFPEKKILIEIEGGTHMRGRHNRASGYEEDCIKQNLAAELGYFVLRFTTAMVMSGIAERQVAVVLGVA